MENPLLKGLKKLSTERLISPLVGEKYRELTLMEWAVYQKDQSLIETLELISKERLVGNCPEAEKITEVEVQKIKLLWQKEAQKLPESSDLLRKLSLLPTLADFYL